jgi:hypothetical protein
MLINLLRDNPVVVTGTAAAAGSEMQNSARNQAIGFIGKTSRSSRQRGAENMFMLIGQSSRF